MSGVEVAVGFLIAWAARRAKRVSEGLGKEADQVLDKALESLHKLVARQLSGDPALARLEQEAAGGSGVSGRTKQRVELSLQDAVETIQGFGEDLLARIGEVERAQRGTGADASPLVNVIGVSNSGSAGVVAGQLTIGNSGTVIGPMTVNNGRKIAATCHYCSREAIGTCVDCRHPLCGTHNQATRRRQINVVNKSVELTVLALWSEAVDKVLCGDCLTAAEEDLLNALPFTPLPSDPKPVVRLIELADREHWSTRHWIGTWSRAVHHAIEELGGHVAVFDTAAVCVLKRTDTEYFQGSRRGDGLDGAVAGEEVRVYQDDPRGTPTGRLAVVTEDMDWFYVHKVAKPGRYSATRITEREMFGVSLTMDLAVPALTDYVYFPQVHDLMPDPWADGERRSLVDTEVLRQVLFRHHWTGCVGQS